MLQRVNHDRMQVEQGEPTVKPIINRIPYKELTPEELARFMYEADLRRAEAVSAHLFAIFGAVKFAVLALGRMVRKVVVGSHDAGSGANPAGAR